MKTRDLIIIGGGCAGMAAALGAHEQGIDDILIIERDQELGGILQQCIHNGFGLQIFKEELSGPAYAQRYKDQIEKEQIAYEVNTTVLSIDEHRMVTYVNDTSGYVQIQAKAIIFACGCYERNRGAISIPGDRGKGVFTAGSVQRYLNMDNVRVGKRVFILGSGDIGLIMARRMTLEGAEVLGVAELMPYSNGLQRNIVQCLEDFQIPLYLSHTVTNIKGKNNVKEITIMQVDEQRKTIPGSEKTFEVDALLLSVGLVPETTILKELGIQLDHATKGAIVDEHFETNISGMYACGNALHVHDLADFVCMEAKQCGMYAAQDILEYHEKSIAYETKAGENIGYVLPQIVHPSCNHDINLCYRVKRPLKQCILTLTCDGIVLKEIKKNYLLPAEMGKFNVKKDELKKVNGLLELKVRELV